MNKEIMENMKGKKLSKYGTSYDKGIRFKEESEDHRPSFYRDIDRVLYSLAYTRYLDKTQVFTHGADDHLSRRMTHVQFVSKIARDIGRALGLNEDLIEAAALGHDLGHAPFGHLGEAILNEISLKHNEGFFNHNIQSVRILMNIENNGEGCNLTLPVLDAIMCHNGEIALGKYQPTEKNKEQFLEEYNNSYHDKNILLKMHPMTLEGCVVRVSDVIAYLGKDMEDAIRIKIIKKEDVPEHITKVLGSTNREFISTVVNDIIKNSFNHNYIKMSDEVFKALNELKEFNYKYIYAKAMSKEEKEEVKKMFLILYAKYLEDLKTENKASIIYTIYLNNMNEEYKKNTKERIVLDFIAGMTDSYMIKQYKSLKKLS